MDEQFRKRAEADLAAIKERESSVKEAIARGDRHVMASGFCLDQLGLFPVYADLAGRLWQVHPDKLVLIGPHVVDDRPRNW